MATALLDTLSNLLVQANILKADQIMALLHDHDNPDDTLDKILIQKNIVARSTLVSLLMNHFKTPFVTLPEKVDIQILKLIPEHLVSAFEVVPISFDAGQLTVAMTTPDSKLILDRVAASTGFRIKPVGILESDFRQFFAKYFEDTTMTQILKEIEIQKQEDEVQNAAQAQEDEGPRPMTKLVDMVLSMAIRKRASDVHIEPQENFALVRFRIDGMLQTQQIIPKAILTSIVSRIKVISEIDISEKRVPQDGKFRHRVLDRDIDVRVATIPSRYGEKVALRILDRRNFLMNLDILGMPAEMQAQLSALATRPNGLILVTGPTGSGKTTSLYAIIQSLRSPRLNIMTLEDPIEYELLAGSKREGGITQIQINPKVGLTFASGLRACLRQDPDVLFVGEIRDKETAETATSAALTGHMVLSTLHTNGAIQTITRLLDMEVEPYLLVSSVRAIVSQRLVRVLCNQCKQPYTPPPEALKRLGLTAEEGTTFYKPQGCGACLQQGYWGRTGVFEMLTFNAEINKLVLARAPAGEIFAVATKYGFKTLKTHGMDLVSQGLTTIDEVLRVLPSL